MKFDVLNNLTGKIQFTADIDCDEGSSYSIKLGLAVEWGIKNSANLRYANFSFADLSSADLNSADLSYADLRSADLSYADLSYADLRSADLSYADLRSANLSYADLRSANLSFADLSFADLRSANLSFADICVLQTNIWTCYIQNEHIRIGRQHHTVSEWANFSDNKISQMHIHALDWWKVWKPIIMDIQKTIPKPVANKREKK